jgi:hypothetical protein
MNFPLIRRTDMLPPPWNQNCYENHKTLLDYIQNLYEPIPVNRLGSASPLREWLEDKALDSHLWLGQVNGKLHVAPVEYGRFGP